MPAMLIAQIGHVMIPAWSSVCHTAMQLSYDCQLRVGFSKSHHCCYLPEQKHKYLTQLKLARCMTTLSFNKTMRHQIKLLLCAIQLNSTQIILQTLKKS